MINPEQRYEILLDELIRVRSLLTLIYNLDCNVDLDDINVLIEICINNINKSVDSYENMGFVSDNECS